MLRSVISFVVCLTPLAAVGAELKLTLSGTAFEGGPAFSASVGETVVGTGVVDPVPADGEGSEFVFQVPDELLKGQSKTTIKVLLTNDKYVKGVGDRNLFILKAQLAGQEIEGKDFKVTRTTGEVGTSGRIYRSDESAVAELPPQSWVPSP